jgi:hypothetical protein
MVWGLPPERAGRAPQASRHSNSADVEAASLALGADAEVIVLEQPPTTEATPTLPASPSS